MTGPFNRAGMTGRIDAILTAYTVEFFAERRHLGIGTDQPVFIVGLPRSGTTLTEQILSAHPLLHGAGAGMPCDDDLSAASSYRV